MSAQQPRGIRKAAVPATIAIVDPLALALAFVVTVFASLVQGTVGVGFAMVAVPVISLIDPELAPVPQLLVALPLTLAMAWRERRSMDLQGVGWIIGGRFPGLFLGLALLAVATQSTLDLAIGSIVLVAVAVLVSDVHIARTPLTKFAAGVGAGVTGMIASMGGPPLALIYSRDEAAMIRSTLAAVFSIGVTTTVIARMATGNVTSTDVRAAAVLFPGVVLGYAAAIVVSGRIHDSAVRIGILAVSALAGAALILRGLTG